MRRAGFTLVEILTVIAIMGTLMAIASVQFNRYLTKTAIERQTRELYSDFMSVRTAAVTQRSGKTVTITPTQVTFAAGGLGGGETVIKTLSKPVTWTGKTASDTEKVIVFDERGIFYVDGNTTICVQNSVEDVQVDSIVLFTTRIHLGKLDFESECNSDNFKAK